MVRGLVLDKKRGNILKVFDILKARFTLSVDFFLFIFCGFVDGPA